MGRLKMKERRLFFYRGLLVLAFFGLILKTSNLWAGTDESSVTIHLKNGDRISGTIVSEDDGQITLSNKPIGTISLKRKYIEKIVSVEKAATEPVKKETAPKLWKREIAAGYNRSSGNTEIDKLSVNIFANRKTEDNEFTIKGDGLLSSSDKKMDAQKWYGMLRYAYSFWKRKWYNFYKLEGDHDRFAQIDYRIIPSTGIGYWFSDRPEWRAMVEVGIGWEHTNFRSAEDNKDEAVLIPRMMIEKQLFPGLCISEDLIVYPLLTDIGEFRLRSETAITSRINDALSFRLSFVDEYNSDPPDGAKKNDAQMTSSLLYSF